MKLPRVLYSFYEHRLARTLGSHELPHHVGVLVDGNRRWAKQFGATTEEGHRAGARKIVEFLRWCHELHIQVVTLYILSTENLNRPAEELTALLDIITNLMCELQDEGICRIQPVGALSTLPRALQEQLECSARRTETNAGPHLNIAVGYGGRQEIVDAVREVFEDAEQREESLSATAAALSVEDISAHLYTRGQPDPDLLIRTSGEQRLSGFLMWQSAYSEFYFCEALWPDFRRVDFLRALRDYARRQRRFGG
ncbi:isoprenyl transferase [Kocuria tytonicola]|uniref:isoprenyl transferase n=1 Tax=Kocuria tytonicola TaxID=2055946 RepID=UPI000EF93CD3|nr:isoprenyl transferase [Kocuria tytonicola]RLZ02459.1 isoprenyl transferase [Kocuria tytonicola]